MSITLDNFGDYLDQAEQRIMNLTPVLNQIGNDMTAQLKANAPESDGGGDLKNSIRLEVQPNSFSVTMLDYGAYQNYGVAPVEGSTSKDKYGGQITPQGNFTIGGVTANKAFYFGSENFGPGPGWGAYYTGLGPHIGWFDDKGGLQDLTREVTRRLQEAINNFFE